MIFGTSMKNSKLNNDYKLYQNWICEINYYMAGNMRAVGFPRWRSRKESACQCRRHRRPGSIPGMGSSPAVGNGNSFAKKNTVFLPGKFHRQRSLGASVHRVTESDTIGRLSTHTHGGCYHMTYVIQSYWLVYEKFYIFIDEKISPDVQTIFWLMLQSVIINLLLCE